MIDITKLTTHYGSRMILDEVSVTFPANQLTALIGPNGAGKSTLLKTIGRLLPPTQGQVSIDDLDVHSAPSAEVAKKVAVLSQENAIASRLTVADLVSFGRFPHSGGRLGEKDFEQINAAMDRVDLTEFKDRYLDELSGGQRQRAFLGMVLAQDTPYILLDEPLNNLDIKHASGLMRHLSDLVATLDKTVVVVLHDINFAAAHADFVVAMRDGQVVKAGPPHEVIDSAILTDTFDTPVTVVPGASLNRDALHGDVLHHDGQNGHADQHDNQTSHAVALYYR